MLQVTLTIKATGRGNRRATDVDRFGFPSGRAPRTRKEINGFRTGDYTRAVRPRKHDIVCGTVKVGAKNFVVAGKACSADFVSLIQRTSGYRMEV